MTLKARLVDSTNMMVLTNFGTNCQGPCYVKHGMFFIENENGGRHTELHRTSLVVDSGFEENRLVVRTLNSVYEYEILEGPVEVFLEELSKINTPMAEKVGAERTKRYETYIVESISGYITPIRLPHPMNWDEATGYIRDNPIPIVPGELAYRVVAVVGPREEGCDAADHD